MQEPRKRSYTLHSGKSNVFLSKQEGIFKINIFFLHNFFYNYFKNFYFFYLYLIILYFQLLLLQQSQYLDHLFTLKGIITKNYFKYFYINFIINKTQAFSAPSTFHIHIPSPSSYNNSSSPSSSLSSPSFPESRASSPSTTSTPNPKKTKNKYTYIKRLPKARTKQQRQKEFNLKNDDTFFDLYRKKCSKNHMTFDFSFRTFVDKR